MSADPQAAVITGQKQSRATRRAKESTMKPTPALLIRWSGLAAMAAGIYFAGIQPIHPPDVLSSVTTGAWAIIQLLKLVMCLFFLLGITGLYARQVEAAGWLGLAGYLLFSLNWALQMPFIFTSAFVMPVLATESPEFVESVLGMVSGAGGVMNLGSIVAVWTIAGLLYMLGGLLFGIATFRAGILPRWPAALLAVTAALTPAAALLPHALQRLAAVPMGVALVWLGYALWSERRARASEPLLDQGSPQLRHTGAD
jgi:hypothetical protein